MKRRGVHVHCDPVSAQRLAAVVREFALAAYPPGGSDCAQAAREALLDTADRCANHTGGNLSLPKRQLPQLRSAVAWYFSDREPGNPALATQLGELLGRNR
jgi:hypothetical protein